MKAPRALSWLLHCGIDKDSDENQARIIKLSNTIALLVGALSMLGYLLALPFLAEMPEGSAVPFFLSAALFAVSVLLVPWLNLKRRHTFARLQIIFLACLGCSIGFVVHGPRSGADIPLIPTLLVAFMLFTPREKLPLAIALVLLTLTFGGMVAARELGFDPTTSTANPILYRMVATVSSFTGALLAAFFYFRDLWSAEERRQRAQEIVEAQQARLINSAKMAALGEMAGGIAHEINNPLMIIDGRVQQLKNMLSKPQSDPGRLIALCDMVGTTVFRIAKIVKGLRTFARDASGDPFTRACVAEIIDEVTALSMEKLKYHEISVSVKIPESPIVVECREAEIAHILLNLVNNAHDAVTQQPEKWIAIEATEREGWVDIAVTDSGKGIPKPLMEKIFMPFFTTKETGQGTGLGLSIAKGLAEVHHGQLWLDPLSAHTRFVLSLPKLQGAAH